jgi:hypothetical protein
VQVVLSLEQAFLVSGRSRFMHSEGNDSRSLCTWSQQARGVYRSGDKQWPTPITSGAPQRTYYCAMHNTTLISYMSVGLWGNSYTCVGTLSRFGAILKSFSRAPPHHFHSPLIDSEFSNTDSLDRGRYVCGGWKWWAAHAPSSDRQHVHVGSLRGCRYVAGRIHERPGQVPPLATHWVWTGGNSECKIQNMRDALRYASLAWAWLVKHWSKALPEICSSSRNVWDGRQPRCMCGDCYRCCVLL